MRIWRVVLAVVVTTLAVAAPAQPRSHAELFRVLRMFEQLQDRTLLTPDATLEFPDNPRTDPSRKRLFTEVPESGVFFTTHVRRLAILTLSGSRATAAATTAAAVDYPGPDGAEFSGVTHILSDRLELRRIRGQWLIASVVRRVRTVGSDAAWHRRQARRERAR